MRLQRLGHKRYCGFLALSLESHARGTQLLCPEDALIIPCGKELKPSARSHVVSHLPARRPCIHRPAFRWLHPSQEFDRNLLWDLEPELPSQVNPRLRTLRNCVIIRLFVCLFVFKHAVFEGSSLVAKWLGFQAFTAVAQVQFLVGELRSCKPCGVAKKKKKKCCVWGRVGG